MAGEEKKISAAAVVVFLVGLAFLVLVQVSVSGFWQGRERLEGPGMAPMDKASLFSRLVFFILAGLAVFLQWQKRRGGEEEDKYDAVKKGYIVAGVLLAFFLILIIWLL